MNHITIGRYDSDPQAQGVIRPEDDSWQLVIDKDGFPHLYIRCKLEDAGKGVSGTGMLCIEDMLPPDVTIRDLMQSTFGGKLSSEEEEQAFEEYLTRKDATGIPCPR